MKQGHSISAKMQRALVICVNYHNEKETQEFVLDLLGLESNELLRILVIDNGRGKNLNKALNEIRKLDSRVQVLKARKNMGYLGAAQWGLREFLSKEPLPDWVMVSNTDIRMCQYDFLTRLFLYYPNDAPAVIAPSILSMSSLRDQNPYMVHRPSKMRMKFYKRVFNYYYGYLLYELFSTAKDKLIKNMVRSISVILGKRNFAKLKPRRIYAPQGSFMIFHKIYFDMGAGFDYGVFLFGEEIFVAESARHFGLTVRYDPRLRIMHKRHSTVGTDLKIRRKTARYVRDASSYCADTFFS